MTDKKFNINLHKKQQLKMLVRRIMQVTGLMEHTADRLVRIALKSGFKDTDKDFFFKNYPEIKKKVDKIIEELHDNICMEVEEGDKEQWLLSAEKNDAMVAGMIGSTRLPKGTIESWNQRNLDALEAFRKRADKGMGLSGRVWNITDQFYQEVELALEMGLGEGKSADVLSREVRKYLKEPHKLFRRVRDEKGNLRLSKAAKAYHPGRGVYRSSYQNAIRMTGTENNMAYRSADHERWNQIPFVIGIEIGLSNNHNCKGVPRGTFYDICDELKGVYPKDFKFVGWHPRCRCHATAKLADMDDFREYQRRKMRDEDVSDYKFQGEVKEMPKCFNEWVEKNRERVEGAKNLPYFIRDNKKVIGWNASPQVRNIKKIELRNTDNQDLDLYKIIPTQNGILRLHKNHGKGETEENIMIGSYLANKHGYSIDLLDNPQNKKSADSYNKTLKIEQEYKKSSTPTKNSIDRLIRDGHLQADDIVLWIDSNISWDDLSLAIRSRVRRCENIQTITIIFKGKDIVLERNQILKESFKIRPADLK